MNKKKLGFGLHLITKKHETLLLSGTDLINTDNIEECRKFIIQKIYQKGHVDE